MNWSRLTQRSQDEAPRWATLGVGGVLLGAVLLGAPWLPSLSQSEAAIYRWVDAEGVVWFTRTPTPPPEYQAPASPVPASPVRDDPGASGVALALGLLVALAALYFLPALIAHRRQNRQWRAIAVLNLFLGWTFLGWVVALVWAFVQPTEG